MFSQSFHRFSCESAENSRFMKTYMKNIGSTLSKLLGPHSLETTVANYRRHQQAGLQHASPWIVQIHMSISFLSVGLCGKENGKVSPLEVDSDF